MALVKKGNELLELFFDIRPKCDGEDINRYINHQKYKIFVHFPGDVKDIRMNNDKKTTKISIVL